MKRILAACLLGSLACAPARAAPLSAIGIENQYADVIRQVGGSHVAASAIETDPNTDPHSFEASPQVASRLAAAALVVENGLGYDGWADRILAATATPRRRVLVVQRLLGVPDGASNPHFWYDPAAITRVANAIAEALAALDPPNAVDYRANAARFTAALQPWIAALAALRTAHPACAVAVTEPVANFMLAAAGCTVATPASLELAIMNGTDPTPQDVTRENALLTGHRVQALVYNRQVTDGLTQSFLARAQSAGIPVVGVSETMPAGQTYAGWMLAETAALRHAIDGAHGG